MCEVLSTVADKYISVSDNFHHYDNYSKAYHEAMMWIVRKTNPEGKGNTDSAEEAVDKSV